MMKYISQKGGTSRTASIQIKYKPPANKYREIYGFSYKMASRINVLATKRKFT